MTPKRKPATSQTAIDNLARWLASEEPTPESVERLSAVPLLFDVPKGARARHGKVLIDSWSATGGVALRDATAGHIRRLRLGSDDIHLDLVAERRHDGWQFTARAHAGESVSHGFVLKVDARKLLPKSGGYYHWSSRRVPRALELQSADSHVTFEQVVWS
jgi:hypothetical protein